jgi:hypothetical protein
MDLGSVKKKITDRKYKTIQQAADDVRLVWSNCMTYNQDGSDFFLLAKNLNKKWEEKYQKLLSDLQLDGSAAASPAAMTPGAGAGAAGGAMGGGGGVDASAAAANNNKISLDDKRTFARTLYKITKEDLGKLIVEVDTKCPQALTKNAHEDECELNVDKLTPALFQELKAFVSNCLKNQPAKNKKTSSSSTGGSSNKRQKT